MNKTIRRMALAAAHAAATAILLFSAASCKGRTMENMEPTGDTVEVTPDTIPSDTTTL